MRNSLVQGQRNFAKTNLIERNFDIHLAPPRRYAPPLGLAALQIDMLHRLGWRRYKQKTIVEPFFSFVYKHRNQMSRQAPNRLPIAKHRLISREITILANTRPRLKASLAPVQPARGASATFLRHSLFSWRRLSPLAMLTLFWGFCQPQVIAQIVPDDTLPVNSIVTPSALNPNAGSQGGGNIVVIDGGTPVGGSLFHSFREFSLPTGGEALFNNSLTIENIVTRVTGGRISNIDGIIRANGSANLLLINPAGINFGANARLQIGGSFLASTADRLLFEEGKFFSAAEPNQPPLLTINRPLGLQLGSAPGGNPGGNPAAIQVRGRGHRLRTGDLVFSPIDRSNSPSGLGVNPGNTLTLVAGDIIIDGGILAVEGGNIELGSVRSGLVELSSALEITKITGELRSANDSLEFGDIKLRSQALADASGFGGGSILVFSRNMELQDGSIMLIQNQGTLPAENIDLRVSEKVELIGISSDGRNPSSIINETLGMGAGGDIIVSSQQLVVRRGGGLATRTYGAAKGGNAIVNSSQSLELSGFSPQNPRLIGGIGTSTFGSGDSGDLTISTQRLRVEGGAALGTRSLGSGSAGTTNTNAAELIEITGINPITFAPSTLSVTAFSAGDAGQLTVKTARLVIREGGRIGSSTFASGNARSVIVNASESIEVSGTVPGSVNPSLLDASANLLDEIIQRTLRLPPAPSGISGDLTVNTPRLIVSNGAEVTARNDGTGDAGTLTVNADFIRLDSSGDITASTTSGEGGNIVLRVQEALELRNGSEISAAAGGTGNGGNITIDTATIAALQGSNIGANAIEGSGGNIQIDTRGVFLSPNSEITASSALGVDGIVSINNPEIDPNSGLVALSDRALDPEHKIATGCAIAQNNEFVVTGRGGLPENPLARLSGQVTWSDWRRGPFGSIERNLVGEALGSPGANTPESIPELIPEFIPELIPEPIPEPIVEATGWRIDESGRVELVVVAPEFNPQRSWHQATDCNGD